MRKSTKKIWYTCFFAFVFVASNVLGADKQYYVYLAGKVRKGAVEEAQQDWRDQYVAALKNKNVKFFTPECTTEDVSKSYDVFSRDVKIIAESNLVLVDGTREIGVGTAQEIMIAKVLNVPVIAVVPPDGKYRKKKCRMNGVTYTNYVHPFLNSTTDLIVDSHKDAILQLGNIEALLKMLQPKDEDFIDASIQHFDTLGIDVKKENVLN